MRNSADPDQLASSEASRSGSTLFVKIGHVVFSKRRVNDYPFPLDELCRATGALLAGKQVCLRVR